MSPKSRLFALLLALAAASCSADDPCESSSSATCIPDARDLSALEAAPDLRANLPLDGPGTDQPARDSAVDSQGGDTKAAADTKALVDAPADAPYVHEDVSVQQVQQWIASGKPMTLLDVREPFEFSAGHIAGSINMAWTSGALKASFSQLSKSLPLLVYCRSGNRSDSAATFLADQGFKPVYDMLGGINAWTAAGYPVE